MCVYIYNRLKFKFFFEWIKGQYNSNGLRNKDLYYPVLWLQVSMCLGIRADNQHYKCLEKPHDKDSLLTQILEAT